MTKQEIEERTKDFTTTFVMDFQIANAFGEDAIKDTFNRAFNEWKDDILYCTDLCITMNRFCWHFYEKNLKDLSMLYTNFYYKVYDYAVEHFKDAEFQYFWEMTD